MISKLKFNDSVIQKMKQLSNNLPSLRFDGKLPKKNQSNPEEYSRRMKLQAAVAVTLMNLDDTASILFTLRSNKVGTHGGQVSFPGGHVESEESFEQAAVRELKEETNLDAVPIFRYHPVRAVTGTIVTPVICVMEGPISQATIDKATGVSPEVDLVFALSIEELCRTDTRKMEKLRGWMMPRFQVHGREHPPVWGLTAIMLDMMLRDLITPALGIPNYPEPAYIVENSKL